MFPIFILSSISLSLSLYCLLIDKITIQYCDPMLLPMRMQLKYPSAIAAIDPPIDLSWKFKVPQMWHMFSFIVDVLFRWWFVSNCSCSLFECKDSDRRTYIVIVFVFRDAYEIELSTAVRAFSSFRLYSTNRRCMSSICRGINTLIIRSTLKAYNYIT